MASTRRFGPALSKRIHAMMTSKDPQLTLSWNCSPNSNIHSVSSIQTCLFRLILYSLLCLVIPGLHVISYSWKLWDVSTISIASRVASVYIMILLMASFNNIESTVNASIFCSTVSYLLCLVLFFESLEEAQVVHGTLMLFSKTSESSLQLISLSTRFSAMFCKY